MDVYQIKHIMSNNYSPYYHFFVTLFFSLETYDNISDHYFSCMKPHFMLQLYNENGENSV